MKVCTFKKKKIYMEMWTIFERKQSLERIRGVRKRKKTKRRKREWCGGVVQFLTLFSITAKITRKALNVEFHFYMIFA